MKQRNMGYAMFNNKSSKGGSRKRVMGAAKKSPRMAKRVRGAMKKRGR